jgi:hypothetical protein
MALRKISLGFEGGQVLSLRVEADAEKSLRKALGSDGWHDLDCEGGEVRVDMARIVYLQTDSAESRVGFGS